MLGYWNYTVLLTYLSVLLACLGIGLCVYNPSHATDYAALCLLTCGLFDMFDGKVARTKKDRTELEKDFGIQIDSLSDLVAFGILPAAIGFRLLEGLWNKWYFVFFAIILLCYVLFGLVRLGYFNALENKRSKEEDTVLKYYTGLPITMASLIIPFVYCFSFFLDNDYFRFVYLGALAIIGLLYVLKIKIPKAGKKLIPAFALIGLALCITIIVLYFVSK
ncbi:MAG: CDP-alcohol phosphatidyltransferase family protein [Acholeplasmatales bacterium]|nr:CDP-alcohol phosphatidyltransferase family protein [Acholeplasmatales bacterium]